MIPVFFAGFGMPGSRQNGFSLLEVLVAFSIMAMSLAALYQASGGSVRAHVQAERVTKAAVLADNLIAAWRVVPRSGVDEQGEAPPDMRWRLYSEPLEVSVESPLWELHRLVVEIEWANAQPSEGYRLISFRPVDPLTR